MDENMKKRNEILAKTVIKGLESRNMSGYYAADKEAAVKQALELIPEGSTIAMGGCASASEVGLISALEDGNYNYLDRSKMSPRVMAEPVSNVIGGSLCFLTMLATVIPELNHMEKQK